MHTCFHSSTINSTPHMETGSWRGEWIKVLCHIYTWNITQPQTNEIMPFVATWMGLEVIITSEVS